MKRITLVIDGRSVTGLQGQTLLQIARKHEIDIPTLCNLSGLHPQGACRVCIVEVVGCPRPVPACATIAEQGMTVTTDSNRLATARRMLVELLLAERNHQCPVCLMNRNCELQSLAQRLDIDHVRYGFISPKMEMDISHRQYGIDHNRCVLCRRCVRACDEVEGAHTWDICGRGAASRIISDLAQPWGESGSCTDCGKCVQACPTGALFEKGVNPPDKGRICFESLLEWREKKQ
jgi:bidirectional [NiFe] hydrogenase diaphorase subunit